MCGTLSINRNTMIGAPHNTISSYSGAAPCSPGTTQEECVLLMRWWQPSAVTALLCCKPMQLANILSDDPPR